MRLKRAGKGTRSDVALQLTKDLDRYVVNLQRQIDMLYELADLGYEDGTGRLTHADVERIETLFKAREEVVEDE